ncbi:MAG: hypothetical protein ACRYF0_17515 [Janthinobacterium lividum]
MSDQTPPKKPENFRQASRHDYFTGKPSPLGYVYEPTTDQLKVGSLQRLADAAERIATALEKLAGVAPKEGGQADV